MSKRFLPHILKKIAGVTLIILGIAGLFLPFFQGILMIVAGLILLGNKKLATSIKNWFSGKKK